MKIKSIKRLNKQEPVYNMTVDDVNCYPISKSNIISHNCDALRYATMYFENKNLNANRAFNVGW